MTTTLVLPDPTSELGAALEVALAACDDADAISMASFRQPIAVDGQARRLLRDGGRHGGRARHPGAHRGALPGSRPGGRGVRRAAVGAAAGAGSSTPSTAPTTTCAACPSSPRLLGLEIDGQLVVGAVSAPALHRRWFSLAGRRGMGRRCRSPAAGTATRRCPSRSPASTTWRRRRSCIRPCPASWPPASRRASWTCWAPSGVTAAWATSMATCWSPRAPLRRWSRPS